ALYPLVWACQLVTRSLNRSHSASVLTRSEFLALAELGAQEGVFARGEGIFSNGFRYLNWLIDVPLLLLQLVVVLGLAAAGARRLGILFVGSGVAMIVLGYIGQFYETTNVTALWIWGAVSTVFYIVLLYLAWTEIGKALPRMPKSASNMLKIIRWVFIIVWTFYPIAYIIPAILPIAGGVVARQFLFTTADIVAKVIYGVMITKVAMDLSRDEGYDPALAKAD
ncbi:MAG: bacteriorhodopsin, partial [Anaerolineae bacterium]